MNLVTIRLNIKPYSIDIECSGQSEEMFTIAWPCLHIRLIALKIRDFPRSIMFRVKHFKRKTIYEYYDIRIL